MSDLDRARIEAAIVSKELSLGLPLSIVSETESTNDDAKVAARNGIETGAAFIADSQTKGRGRRGQPWHSPKGASLYVSFVLRPPLLARDTPPLALAAGLAVVDAVMPSIQGDRLRVKWPNDVLLDGKKLAGILIETSIAGERASSVIVGIGLNVHTREFPSEISKVATSLVMGGAASPRRDELFIALCQALERRVREQLEGGVKATVEALAKIDYLAGKALTIEGKSALALGIAEDGRLRIRDADGEERAVSAGEVTIGTGGAA